MMILIASQGILIMMTTNNMAVLVLSITLHIKKKLSLISTKKMSDQKKLKRGFGKVFWNRESAEEIFDELRIRRID